MLRASLPPGWRHKVRISDYVKNPTIFDFDPPQLFLLVEIQKKSSSRLNFLTLEPSAPVGSSPKGSQEAQGVGQILARKFSHTRTFFRARGPLAKSTAPTAEITKVDTYKNKWYDQNF